MELANFRHIPGTRLYRSSRPDNIGGSDLETFLSYDFHSIIDLRSMREFPSASTSKSIDDHFQVFDVRVNKNGSVKTRCLDRNRKVAEVRTCTIAQYNSALLASDGRGRHFVFDMVSIEYVQAVVRRLPWTSRSMLYALFPMDYLFGTNWFLKSLVRQAINAHGILGQYKDIIDHCGQKVCIVLQTLSCHSNSPALVVCTYGKDRTGIIVALVLSVLGWSPRDIAADYAKSKAELEKAGSQVFGYLQQLNFNQSFYTSEHDTMVELLDYICQRYGSVERYLTQLGFDSIWQEKLRSALVDTRSDPPGPGCTPPAPEIDLPGSMAHPPGSATDPPDPKTDPSGPKTDPSGPETDPSGPKTDPSGPKTDPSDPETDPSGPETDPSGPKTDPSDPETDPAVAKSAEGP